MIVFSKRKTIKINPDRRFRQDVIKDDMTNPRPGKFGVCRVDDWEPIEGWRVMYYFGRAMGKRQMAWTAGVMDPVW